MNSRYTSHEGSPKKKKRKSSEKMNAFMMNENKKKEMKTNLHCTFFIIQLVKERLT